MGSLTTTPSGSPLQNIAQREAALLAPYAFRSAESRGRQYPEPESATRTAFTRDRDRIIHTTAFRRLMAEKRGETTAEVTSAEPLTDEQVTALKAALKDSLGKDVALDARVDPALIGGLIVKVGSRMIDSSLRTKLSSLKLAMKEVG